MSVKNSYMDLLIEAFPEYDWLPWKFNNFSFKSLLTNANRKQRYVEWMAMQLNIQEMKDWYNVKTEVK